MKNYLLILLFAMPIHVFAQAKPATEKILDVDRLYAKYKDKEEIILYTPEETIKAKVLILYNEKNKPYAVVLYGAVRSSSAVQGIIDDLVMQKKKAGYKYKNSDMVLFPSKLASVTVSVYQYGTQYAKYGSERGDILEGTNFYFEVGDINRKSSGKTEKFVF